MIFRGLSEKYGWTMEDIGRMSFAQMYYYSCDPAELRHGKIASLRRYEAMRQRALDEARERKGEKK